MWTWFFFASVPDSCRIRAGFVPDSCRIRADVVFLRVRAGFVPDSCRIRAGFVADSCRIRADMVFLRVRAGFVRDSCRAKSFFHLRLHSCPSIGFLAGVGKLEEKPVAEKKSQRPRRNVTVTGRNRVAFEMVAQRASWGTAPVNIYIYIYTYTYIYIYIAGPKVL